MGWKAAAFLLATGILHLFYFASLQKGYQTGDLSVVYPLARGTGPLLSFGGAVLVLHEHPTVLAVTGALLVVAGIMVLSGGRSLLRAGNARVRGFLGRPDGSPYRLLHHRGRLFGKGLAALSHPGGLCRELFRAAVLTPAAWMDWPRVRAEFRTYWKYALGSPS